MLQKPTKLYQDKPDHIAVKIPMPPFNCVVLVVFCEDSDILNTVTTDQWGIRVRDEPFGKSQQGYAADYHDGDFLLWMKDVPDTPVLRSYLAHEIFHIVSFIATRAGMTLGAPSEEAYAYMTSYLTEAIYKHLDTL